MKKTTGIGGEGTVAAVVAVMAESRGPTNVERMRQTPAAEEEEEECAKSEMMVRTRHVRVSRSRTGREQVSVLWSCFADSGRRTTTGGGCRHSALGLVVASRRRCSGEKDVGTCCSSVRGSETTALLRARGACIARSVVDHQKTTTAASPSRPCPWYCHPLPARRPRQSRPPPPELMTTLLGLRDPSTRRWHPR